MTELTGDTGRRRLSNASPSTKEKNTAVCHPTGVGRSELVMFFQTSKQPGGPLRNSLLLSCPVFSSPLLCSPLHSSVLL